MYVKSEIEMKYLEKLETETKEEVNEVAVDPVNIQKQAQQKPKLSSTKGKHKRFTKEHCILCEKDFSDEEILRRHEAEHLRGTEYLCPKCSFCNSDKTEVFSHFMVIHKNKCLKICCKCGRGFSQFAYLRNHLSVHNIELDDVTCCVCFKSCKDRRARDKHQAKVHDKQENTNLDLQDCNDDDINSFSCICPECGETFNKSSQLTNHMQRQHKSPQKKDITPQSQSCHLCGESFKENFKYKNHMLRHEAKEKQFSCEQCGEAYFIEYDLRLHVQNKHNQRFHCDLCDYKTNQKGNYDRHVKVHTGEKSHICKYCGKAFSDQTGLRNHENIHTRVKEYPCPGCAEKFFSRASLRDHNCFKSPKNVSCEKCSAVCKSPLDLRKHKQTHYEDYEFQCLDCRLGYVKFFFYQQHMQTKHGQIVVQPRPVNASAKKINSLEKKSQIQDQKLSLSQQYLQNLQDFLQRAEEKKTTESSADCGLVKPEDEKAAEDLRNRSEESKERNTLKRCDDTKDTTREQIDEEYDDSHHNEDFPASDDSNDDDCQDNFNTFEKLEKNENDDFKAESKFEVKEEVMEEDFSQTPNSEIILKVNESKSIPKKKEKEKRKKRKKRRFCQIEGCGEKFCNRIEQAEHTRTVHNINVAPTPPPVFPFSCPHEGCLKRFKKKFQIRKHALKFHNLALPYERKTTKKSKTLKCQSEGCSQMFIYPHSLIKHVKMSHGNGPQEIAKAENYLEANNAFNTILSKPRKDKPCPFCKQQFFKMTTLVNHMKSEHPDERDSSAYNDIVSTREPEHLCPVCAKSFTQQGLMERHMIDEHEYVSEETMSCEVCGQICRNKEAYRTHVKSHQDDPSLCIECGLTFRTKKLLQSHRTKMHPMKIYQCDICQEILPNYSKFKKHEALVHNRGDHECQDCGRRFDTTEMLRRHRNSAHEKVLAYICEQCGHKHARMDHLNHHRGKNHGSEKLSKKDFVSLIKSGAHPFCDKSVLSLM